MPTSSQALILQTSTGELPPLFHRRIWQPDQSFRHLPFTGNQHRRANQLTNKQRNESTLFPLRRSGSEPTLVRKYDISTLQHLLQIRRLGTSSTYDNKTDFYTMSMRPRELAPIRRNRYIDNQYDARNDVGQRLFIPEFKRSTKDRKQEIHLNNDGLKCNDVEVLNDCHRPTDFKMKNVRNNPTYFQNNKVRRQLPDVQVRYGGQAELQTKTKGHTFTDYPLKNDDLEKLTDFQIGKDGQKLSDPRARHDGQKPTDFQVSRGELKSTDMHTKSGKHTPAYLKLNHDGQHYQEVDMCNGRHNSTIFLNSNNTAKNPVIFMKSKIDEYGLTLEMTNGEDADYFRLFEIESDPSEPAISTIFCLMTATSSETGSFQLTPTSSDNLGNFRLVPPDGYDSDDGYRLQAVSEGTNTFTLLQRDPHDNGVFKMVVTDWSGTETVGHHKSRLQNHTKSAIRDERSGGCSVLPNRPGIEPLKRRSTSIEKIHRSAERIDDILGDADLGEQLKNSQNEATWTTADTDWKSYAMKSGLHHPDNVMVESDEILLGSLTERQRDDQKKKQEFMGSIRNQSVDMYERLVNLGFRRANEDPDKVSFYENIRTRAEKEREKYFSSDWKTDNADQRSRVLEHFGMSGNDFLSLDNSSLLLRQLLPGQPSLLDDINKDSNNQTLKKKIKALRMRKEPPPKDPNAICISLHDNAISHSDLKRKIELEIGGLKVASLQFDPLSVHCSDSEVKSQWIIRLSNRIICEYLTKCGINIDGVHYSVKSYDDVMQKEHNAYRFYMAFSDTKLRKGNGQKSKRVKQTNSSETQTGSLPPLKQINVL